MLVGAMATLFLHHTMIDWPWPGTFCGIRAVAGWMEIAHMNVEIPSGLVLTKCLPNKAEGIPISNLWFVYACGFIDFETVLFLHLTFRFAFMNHGHRNESVDFALTYKGGNFNHIDLWNWCTLQWCAHKLYAIRHPTKAHTYQLSIDAKWNRYAMTSMQISITIPCENEC